MIIVTRAQEFVAELATEDILCVLGRRGLPLPCAMLERPSITPEGHLAGRPCDDRLVVWPLWLLVKGADDLSSWQTLDDMVDSVFRLYGQNILSAEPTMFDINETISAPAYKITIEESV